jgi:TonB family protein
MRSTFFVIFSAALHALAVAAVAVLPSKIASGTNSENEVEMVVNDPVLTPGVEVAEAEVTAAPTPAEEIKTPPVEIVKPEVKEVKKEAKATSKPKKAVAKVEKALPQKSEIATELPAKEASPEKLDPVISDEDTVAVAPAATASKAESETKQEEVPVFHPVKENVAGVEAMSADEETEATSQEINDSDEQTEGEQPGAAVEKSSTTEQAKGGAGQKGTVSYLDLKQMPGNKAPSYPMRARREGHQGQVELLYRVTKEGKVEGIQIAKSSGFKDLDQEAVKAVSSYRFVPGQEGWARHPINFELKGEAATLPSRLRSTTNAQTE